MNDFMQSFKIDNPKYKVFENLFDKNIGRLGDTSIYDESRITVGISFSNVTVHSLLYNDKQNKLGNKTSRPHLSFNMYVNDKPYSTKKAFINSLKTIKGLGKWFNKWEIIESSVYSTAHVFAIKNIFNASKIDFISDLSKYVNVEYIQEDLVNINNLYLYEKNLILTKTINEFENTINDLVTSSIDDGNSLNVLNKDIDSYIDGLLLSPKNTRTVKEQTLYPDIDEIEDTIAIDVEGILPFKKHSLFDNDLYVNKNRIDRILACNIYRGFASNLDVYHYDGKQKLSEVIKLDKNNIIKSILKSNKISDTEKNQLRNFTNERDDVKLVHETNGALYFTSNDKMFIIISSIARGIYVYIPDIQEDLEADELRSLIMSDISGVENTIIKYSDFRMSNLGATFITYDDKNIEDVSYDKGFAKLFLGKLIIPKGDTEDYLPLFARIPLNGFNDANMPGIIRPNIDKELLTSSLLLVKDTLNDFDLYGADLPLINESAITIESGVAIIELEIEMTVRLIAESLLEINASQ